MQIPEKIEVQPLDIFLPMDLVNKLNEIIDYLKEKELKDANRS